MKKKEVSYLFSNLILTSTLADNDVGGRKEKTYHDVSHLLTLTETLASTLADNDVGSRLAVSRVSHNVNERDKPKP